jgi:hypothetical protein
MIDTDVASAMLEHCQKVYEALQSDAVEELVGEDGDEQAVLAWTGHMTKVIRDCGLPSPYYTTVLNHMKRMGCIEQARRGGGTATSKWYLWTAPTNELFTTAQSAKKSGGQVRMDMLEQGLKDLKRRVEVIEKYLGVKLS